MAGTDDETDRTVVKTYVPRYQKDRWKDDAEALDMSQSEFVRTMVQAGRRGFDLESRRSAAVDDPPGGDGVKDRVLGALETEAPLDWEALVARLSNDFEDQLDDALSDLQADNRVVYSGRHGGYVLLDTDER